MPSALELIRGEYFAFYPSVTERGTHRFLSRHLERFAGRGDARTSAIAIAEGQACLYMYQTENARPFVGHKGLLACYSGLVAAVILLGLLTIQLRGFFLPNVDFALVLGFGLVHLALAWWSLRGLARMKALKAGVLEWGLDFTEEGTRLWALGRDGRTTDTFLDGAVTFVGTSQRVQMLSLPPRGGRTVSLIVVRIGVDGVILTASDRASIERIIADLRDGGFDVALFDESDKTLDFSSSEAFFRL